MADNDYSNPITFERLQDEFKKTKDIDKDILKTDLDHAKVERMLAELTPKMRDTVEQLRPLQQKMNTLFHQEDAASESVKKERNKTWEDEMRTEVPLTSLIDIVFKENGIDSDTDSAFKFRAMISIAVESAAKDEISLDAAVPNVKKAATQPVR